jgi:signal transduction histidine kinase
MTPTLRRSIPALLAVTGVAIVALLVARRQPDWALVGSSGLWLAFELAGALAVALAGVLVRLRGADLRSGGLLLIAAGAWLTAEWNNPGALGAIVFTVGLAAGELAPAVVAHTALVHGGDQGLAGLGRVAVAAAYATSGLMLGLASALVTDPRAHGCASCPSNLALLVDSPSVGESLQRWGLRCGAVALAAAGALAIRRLRRCSVARRHAIAPVVVPCVAFLGVVVARYAHDLSRGYAAIDRVDQSLRLAEGGALLAIAAGVAWQRLAATRMRARLARVVVEMATAARPGELGELLAAALGDSTLEVLYAFDDSWVDSEGHPHPLPGELDRDCTSLAQDGEIVAVVVHRRGLLDDPQLVQALEHAARLALDHERLQAHLRAQLERLRLARTAIVAAHDDERRRLERDLHDGAQQGLAGLAMAIELERATSQDLDTTRLRIAQEQIRTALDRVRTIAHSLYPAALSDAGLAAALDVLAEWRPHLELADLPARRFEPALEAGAYFVVAALTESPAPAAVSARADGDRLVVEVRTARPADLSEVEDRLGALEGRLALELICE